MARAEDHQNVTTFVLPGGPAFAPHEPTLVRARIDAIVAQLRGNRRRGGTLYIPRVRDGQLWIDVTTPLRIPREVTLSLAPGVVLVPLFRTGMRRSEGNHINIEGVLDAPIATIFATPEWFSRHPLEGAERYDVGTFRLSSPHLERVHPEWWGAADEGDTGRPSDDDALEAALHAALRDRAGEVVMNRLPLRVLPIELRGTYTLARTLRITAGSAGTDRGLELRGVAGPDALPTFRCGARFSPRDPMLLIEGMKSVSMEDVRFDGAGRTSSCLTIRGASGGSAERAHLLRRCGFRGATRALVSYDANAAPPTQDALGPLPAEGLRFEHCRFLPQVYAAKLGVALALSGPEATSVDVRGCTFRGEAAAMIHVATCSLAVAGCHFHNTLLPLLPSDATSSDTLHSGGPVGGADVYLDGFDDGFAATLYAQDCRSTSPQFLITRAGGRGASGNVTLVGLHYTRGPEVVLRRQTPWVREDRADRFSDRMEVTPIAPALATPAQKVTPSKPTQLPAPSIQAPPSKLAQPFTVSTNTPSSKLAPGVFLEKVPEEPPERNPFGVPLTIDPAVLPRPDHGEELQGKPGVSMPLGGPEPGIPFSPVLWRLPTEGGGRLIVMGCRFDFPLFDTSVCVRGTPGASAIVDLGVLRGDGRATQISADASTGRIGIPTWPHRP